MIAVITSAGTQRSDSSDLYTISDSSMIEFVRQLNDQGANKCTVDNFHVVDTDHHVHKEKPLSPVISDAEYIYDSHSNLIPTASSSVLNFYTGGKFRRKITSFGNALFGKSASSGVQSDCQSETDREELSPLQSAASGSSTRSKMGFVHSSKSEARKLKKEAKKHAAEKVSKDWLKTESSCESAVPPLFGVGQMIPQPSSSADANEMFRQCQVEVSQKYASEATERAPEGPKKPMPISEPTPLKAHKHGSPGKAKTKPKKITHQVNGLAHRSAFETSVVSAITGIPPPVSPKPCAIDDGRVGREVQVKEEQTSPDTPAKATNDASFEKMKETVKNVSSQKPSKRADDKNKPDAKPSGLVRTESGRIVPRSPRKKSPRPLVAIDNIPVPLTLPREKPPMAMINPPRTGLPKEVDEDHERGRDRTAKVVPMKIVTAEAIRPVSKPQPEERSITLDDHRLAPMPPSGLHDEKPPDRAAELQFSPFVVAGLAEHSRSRHATMQNQTFKTTEVSEEAPEIIQASTRKAAASTILPSWVKLPDTLRSGKHGLTPRQRLTTLFTGPDSTSQANTVSDNAVFSPREPDETRSEKPTMQSLGELFGTPQNTPAFGQPLTGARLDATAEGVKTPDVSPSGRSSEFNHWRQKFKFGFSSSKDSKVTKPKTTHADRDRVSAAVRDPKDRRPKGILKTPVQQGAFPVQARSEVVGMPPNARLPRRQSGRRKNARK
ncbi:hypothetical protein OY671_003017 [Metschnikowia pulcherrima]|nr:hypothetical protein OY671_003017 [Metschnikowia pulcherrima]